MTDDVQLLIGGEMVEGARRSDVVNPADETPFATAPRASLTQLYDAVSAASAALPGWRRASAQIRASALLLAAERIRVSADALALTLTLEQGRPLAMARGEVLRTADYFQHFAQTGLQEEIEEAGGRRTWRQYGPLGVVGAIVPWNYPLLLMAFKVPAALMMGNTVVLKPAGTTPLATLQLARCIADLFPPGVLNVIADDNDLGAAMVAHPDIRKVSFTGSTEVGRKVMASAADTLKRVTLELGGNDPAIVLDDADPSQIAPLLFRSAFVNSGQVCIAVKRVYAPARLYDRLCDALRALSDQAVVGDGRSPDVQFGPLQNNRQYERVQALLDGAARDGEVLHSKATIPERGYFIAPTIVRDIRDGAALVEEEQFGPLLPIVRYERLDDVVAGVNASEFGLGASIWGVDEDAAFAVARQIEAGTVWINKHADLAPDIPFCGAKQSGVGVELGVQGLKEFGQLKVINA